MDVVTPLTLVASLLALLMSVVNFINARDKRHTDLALAKQREAQTATAAKAEVQVADSQAQIDLRKLKEQMEMDRQKAELEAQAQQQSMSLQLIAVINDLTKKLDAVADGLSESNTVGMSREQLRQTDSKQYRDLIHEQTSQVSANTLSVKDLTIAINQFAPALMEHGKILTVEIEQAKKDIIERLEAVERETLTHIAAIETTFVTRQSDLENKFTELRELVISHMEKISAADLDPTLPIPELKAAQDIAKQAVDPLALTTKADA